MDTLSIKYFLKVCELKNITKAAEKLHISQPALSRRIMALEDEVGVKLLNRLNSSLSLTEGGRLFFEEATSLVNYEEALKEKMDRYRRGLYGKVRIGYDSRDYIEPIIYAGESMSRLYPGIEIEFKEMPHKYARSAYDYGSVDVIYTLKAEVGEIDDSILVDIVKNRIGVLVPKGHRLWNQKIVCSSELEGERFAMQKTRDKVFESAEQMYANKGISFQDAVLCENASERLFHIASGKFIGIGMEHSRENYSAFSKYIRLIPLSDFEPDLITYCALYHDTDANAEQFVNCMKVFTEEDIA